LSRESKTESLEGYSGVAQRLLKEAGASKGSKISIRTLDGFEVSGLVVSRYEGDSTDYIVLKLKSGYNVGIDAKTISSLTLVEDSPSEARLSSFDIPTVEKDSEKTVLLLSTGGTIASKVDYRTGAVKPAYTASDLYSAVPELATIAKIRPEIVFSTFSENLAAEHWKQLSEHVVSRLSKGADFDGIVVMLGTDTMGYVSSALGFSLIGIKVPLVCVGSQRSSDRPSADSALNLQAATRFAANSGVSGVFVAMHENENDVSVGLHSGVRVRKNHTSRRDAFESIDIPLFARVEKDKILFNSEYGKISVVDKHASRELEFKTNFESKVSLIKFHPGLDPSIFDYLSYEKGVKGLILEGTGLGHVSSQCVGKLKELVSKGIFVGMTSQCVWGHVDLNVYSTGIDLIRAGVVPLGNMLSETAFVKLSWVLGNFPDQDPSTLMTQNLVGEMTERILLAI
jgi:glutamyl-tRNA(Gln) amidotransferase subunit D